MRTETHLKGREVLALWMKSCNIKDFPELPTAAVQNGMGKNGEKRDFLSSPTGETYITQGKNSARKSCLVIYLDALPQPLSAQLKEGKCCCF